MKVLCLGEILEWFYLKQQPVTSDPCLPAPRQSNHLALAAGQALGERGGYWEVQPLRSGILFKYRKKPHSFTPSEHQREKRCGNPCIAGGATFISV